MLRTAPTIHVGGSGASSGLSTSGLGMSGLPGCKSSLINSQAITSSGSAGLNQILGGGIPVGTVLVFEEAPVILHSKRFLHVISAEGLSLGHRIAVATPPDSSAVEDFVSLIPSRSAEEIAGSSEAGRTSGREAPADPDSLRIAWRYESTPVVNPTLGGTVSSASCDVEYDLGKRLDPSKVTNIHTFNPKIEEAGKPHQALLQWLISESAATGPRNLLRVVLPSIDSPLWDFADEHAFCRFLYQLRSVVRHTNTIVSLTVSRELHDPVDLNRIRRLADAYIALETFPHGAAPRSALFKDFQSICRLQKGFAINALRFPALSDYEFGLKIRKRRITFERLHLPPELQDTTQRESSGGKKPTNLSVGLNCQTVVENGLDF